VINARGRVAPADAPAASSKMGCLEFETAHLLFLPYSKVTTKNAMKWVDFSILRLLGGTTRWLTV